MFFENVTFSAAELNTAVNVVKEIDISQENVSSIILANGTGASLSFAVMTLSEYNAWILDGTISDLMTIANNGNITIDNIRTSICRVIALGTAGHGSNLTVVIIKGK